MTQAECAQALGISKASVALYEKGSRPEGEVTIPKTVALACNAVSNGLPPISDGGVVDRVMVQLDISSLFEPDEDGFVYSEHLMLWSMEHLKHMTVIKHPHIYFFARSDAFKFARHWLLQKKAYRGRPSNADYASKLVDEGQKAYSERQLRIQGKK